MPPLTLKDPGLARFDSLGAGGVGLVKQHMPRALEPLDFSDFRMREDKLKKSVHPAVVAIGTVATEEPNLPL